MSTKRFYNNYLSTHFGSLHTGKDKEFKIFYKYYKKNYLRHLPKNKHAKILDIGCGTGHFLYFLKKSGYKKYSGIDLSEEAIKFCKKKKLASTIIKADAESYLKKSQTKYDVIIMNDVIEHIPKNNIVKLLSLIKKQLSKNGKLIIKTINVANPITGNSSRYLDFTHTTGFTQESLSQVIKVSGFRNVKIYAPNIWVFNFLVNIMGVIFDKILSLIFRLLFLLHGRKSTTIFSKNIIAVAN